MVSGHLAIFFFLFFGVKRLFCIRIGESIREISGDHRTGSMASFSSSVETEPTERTNLVNEMAIIDMLSGKL